MDEIDDIPAAMETLFGPGWRPDLPRELAVSHDAIPSWAAGTNDLPPGVALRLTRLCEQCAQTLVDLMDGLRKAATH